MLLTGSSASSNLDSSPQITRSKGHTYDYSKLLMQNMFGCQILYLNIFGGLKRFKYSVNVFWGLEFYVDGTDVGIHERTA
jgi:hypothetical protein